MRCNAYSLEHCEQFNMGKKHSNKAAGINSRIREDLEFRKNDMYEAEDNDPQENIDAGRRYDVRCSTVFTNDSHGSASSDCWGK